MNSNRRENKATDDESQKRDTLLPQKSNQSAVVSSKDALSSSSSRSSRSSRSRRTGEE